MNYKNIFLTLLFVIFCVPMHGMETTKDRDEQKSQTETATTCATKSKIVIHNFDAALPAELRASIVSQKALFHAFMASRANIDTSIVPGWIIKRRFAKLDRIEGAKTFAAAIHKGNYDQLTLPEKYALNKDFSIAKKVTPITEKINLKQTQQLYGLAQDLHWADTADNFAKIAANRVVIWDTEMSFLSQSEGNDLKIKILTNILLSKQLFDYESVSFLEKEQIALTLKSQGYL